MCRAGPARNDQSMASALLDRPVQEPVTAPLAAALTALPSAAAAAPVTVAPAARKRWSLAGAVIMLAAAATAVGVELSQANLAGVLARVQPWQAAAAAGWILLSLVAAAYNLTGFSAVRVPLWRSLQAQLAISGLRVFTPSAVSTCMAMPAWSKNALNRAALSRADCSARLRAVTSRIITSTASVPFNSISRP